MPKWWDTSAGAWGLSFIGLGVGAVVSYITSPQVGIPIGIAITLTGIFLIIRARHTKAQREDIAGTLEQLRIAGRLEDVSPQDANLILLMSIDLEARHGHNDITALLADRASNVPLNELKTRLCSQCGIPRNQKSKKNE